MNIQAYLKSGILEMYALNQLDLAENEDVELMISFFPQLRKELESIEHALEMYAASQSIQPRSHVKDKINESICNLKIEQEMDLQHLPLINNHSDYIKWMELVKDLIPSELEDHTPFTQVLKKSDKLLQMLVVTSSDVEDEVHTDEFESFLLLKGNCTCTVGQNVRLMKAGDFMAIPLHEHHTVEVTSGTVVAILQRITV